MRKRILTLFLALSLLLAGVPFAHAEATIVITSENVPLYLTETSNKEEITLYYKDGQTDIPYIDMETARMLILRTQAFCGDDGYELTLTQEDDTAILTRENGSRVLIDFAREEMTWENYDLFTAKSYSPSLLDILGHKGFDENGEPYMFERNLRNSYLRRGEDITIRFADFGIDLMLQDGRGYMPLVTVSDLLIAYKFYNIGYNGKAVFLLDYGFEDMRELYYDVEPGPRSEALARFNYNELCLSLQFNYGLKDAHNIPSFGTLFALTGMEDRLLSSDALEADAALYDVIGGYIDDLHTQFRAASPYAGDINVKEYASVKGWSDQRIRNGIVRMNAAAEEAFPDGMPSYQEIGNTAYITFDSFDADFSNEYYSMLEAGQRVEDTIGIIMYAHSQIMRENSPIENVVLDLSKNTGGLEDAAIFTIAWFLGDCTIHLENAITGAQGSHSYNIDTNGDKVFDERDTVQHLNRYCLISNVSFSCGNLVPAAYKSSGEVTLLGRRTGGGACVVQPLTTADGSYWQASGQLRISTTTNGSYYDADQGVEPDIVLDTVEAYYNREALTEYINGLF